MAADVEVSHLAVGQLAVFPLCPAGVPGPGRSRTPAGYRACLGQVHIELAVAEASGVTPVSPAELPSDRRSAHAHVDVVWALHHPGPADHVRLHAHRGGRRTRPGPPRAGERGRRVNHVATTPASTPNGNDGALSTMPSSPRFLSPATPPPQGHALDRPSARGCLIARDAFFRCSALRSSTTPTAARAASRLP